MPAFPRDIAEFMATHGVLADEVWKIPQGNAYAIKHKALERVAAQAGITYEPPKIFEADGNERCVAICVTGKLGERTEWSIGEASPHNYRISGKMAAYPYAMAEKRGKDRVILKLLNAHGALYSEDEADNFKRENPHVTRPSDIYDGELSADIPDVPATKMKVKDARPQFAALVKEMQRIQDPGELAEWGTAQAEAINSLPGEWPQMFRGEYTKHKAEITRAA